MGIIIFVYIWFGCWIFYFGFLYWLGLWSGMNGSIEVRWGEVSWVELRWGEVRWVRYLFGVVLLFDMLCVWFLLFFVCNVMCMFRMVVVMEFRFVCCGYYGVVVFCWSIFCVKWWLVWVYCEVWGEDENMWVECVVVL